MTNNPGSTNADGAWAWVADLAPVLGELHGEDLAELAEFDQRLRRNLAEPVESGASEPVPTPRRPERGEHQPSIVGLTEGRVGLSPQSRRLLVLRQRLAPGTVCGSLGPAADDGAASQPQQVKAALAQTIRQFLAGFHDVDLRDASGAGHGLMILRHARPELAGTWARRLDAGALAGTAMTEQRGGSRLHPGTLLVPDGPRRWRLHGAKRWISRLHEASVFVVSASDQAGHTVAVLVDADRDGLSRRADEPAGLGGWSWGALDLDAVPVADADLLDRGCGPDGPFAAHFAGYRQLVTATALGAAAGVGARVAALLRERTARGEIARVGDHALIVLATSDAALRAAWHECVHTARLAARDPAAAAARSAAAKAHGIETARRAADGLAALAGATGFTRSHPIAKARADLEALRFADGAHDSLRRYAGAQLLHPTPPRSPGP